MLAVIDVFCAKLLFYCTQLRFVQLSNKAYDDDDDDDEKCILVKRVCVCVCLSLAACPHYCTDLNVTLGNGRGCSLVVHYLGGFAIGARVSLL